MIPSILEVYLRRRPCLAAWHHCLPLGLQQAMFSVLQADLYVLHENRFFGSEHLLNLWLLSLLLQGKLGTAITTFPLLSSSVSSVPSAMTI